MTRKKRALNDEMKEYYSNANAKPGRKETDLNTEMLEYFYNANVNGGGGGGGAVASVNGHTGVVELTAEDIQSKTDWTPTLPIDLTTKNYVDDYVDRKKNFDRIVFTNPYSGITSRVNELYHVMDATTYGYGDRNNFNINYIDQIEGLPRDCGDSNTLLTFNTANGISNQILLTTNGDMYISNIQSSSEAEFKKVVTQTARQQRMVKDKDLIIEDLLKRVEVLEAKLASK